MDNLSEDTKQALKRYRYQLIDIDTNEWIATFYNHNAASKAQKILADDFIFCKVITTQI